MCIIIIIGGGSPQLHYANIVFYLEKTSVYMKNLSGVTIVLHALRFSICVNFGVIANYSIVVGMWYVFSSLIYSLSLPLTRVLSRL